eukprot:6606632-Prymnesium_polylepis.1
MAGPMISAQEGLASSDSRSGAPAPFCKARRRTNMLPKPARVLRDAQHGHVGHAAKLIPGLVRLELPSRGV